MLCQVIVSKPLVLMLVFGSGVDRLGSHAASVAVRRREGIGRMREGATYFSPASEARRPRRRPRRNYRADAAGADEDVTASLITFDNDALIQMQRWWYISWDVLVVSRC